MEETSFVSGILKSSEPSYRLSSSDVPEAEPEPRETFMTIIMCVCLVAMMSLVAVLVISSSGLVRGDSGVAATDDLDRMKPAARPPASRKVEGTGSTKRQMGGSSRVTVQPMSTAAPTVMPIICTVGQTATSENMYPPEQFCDYIFYTNVYAREGRIYTSHDYDSWTLFQKMAVSRRNTEFGISFSFELVTPDDLDESAGFLDTLRRDGIRHYGLLTVLTFEDGYHSTIARTRAVIAKLKDIQGSDQRAKTVLAFGLYYYNDNFMPVIKKEFINVANTFMADIVIAITSAGWSSGALVCNAVPPNSIETVDLRRQVLGSHWFAVSEKTTFSKPSIITGLSFELSALEYIMENTPTSLYESVYSICTSVKKTGREALCKHRDFTGGPNYLGDPIYAYGVFSNTSKVLTLSEYADTLVNKILKALSDFGGVREHTAWLLYNVHNDDPDNQCRAIPFDVIAHFHELRKAWMDRLIPY